MSWIPSCRGDMDVSGCPTLRLHDPPASMEHPPGTPNVCQNVLASCPDKNHWFLPSSAFTHSVFEHVFAVKQQEIPKD